jgi:6-methylsalicylate decarboxylase
LPTTPWPLWPVRDAATPGTDLALSEIALAYDVLHADSVGLSTSNGGFWLGDKRNASVFAELIRRKAAVIFPTVEARRKQ